MTDTGSPTRRRIFVAVGLAVAVTGAWVYWSRTHESQAPGRETSKAPFVRVAVAGSQSGDRVLAERSELFDPTPLFIPTERNFGQGWLPARVVRQPDQVFGNYEAKLNFEDNGIATYGVSTETAPDSLSEVLARGNEAPLAGLGQVDVARTPLAPRAGFIEVKNLKDGHLAISAPLTAVELPRRDFAPMEFLITVGDAGLLGEPVLTASSGFEDLDAILRVYLAKRGRVGEKLPPGRYLVFVGP